ncbi:MAG: TPM domain-containing protein [Planctomycetota bacterium]
MVWLTGAAFWFLLAGLPVQPAPGEFCTDGAGMLTAGDRAKINAIVRALVKDHAIPVHVVTVRALASHGAEHEGIESFARRLFDHWGIGSADHNYGMLLLVAKVDRKARIEFGAGWARTRDDAAHRIMQNLILPDFRDGEFSAGILRGVQGLDSMARGKPLPKRRLDKSSIQFWVVVLVVLIIFVLLAKAVGRKEPWRRRVRERRKDGWRARAARRAWRNMVQGYDSSFWTSGSGGGGGGFSSGGGGFSGGGGATGSW